MTGAQPEPGSFRDREGRVYYHSGDVYRALSRTALEEWRSLIGAEFFRTALAEGRIVETEQVETAPPAPDGDAQTWAGTLRHRKIPFISYPYEWSFSMLREAALLQLSLLLEALEEEFTLKDASSYNIQWEGVSPVFIDVASFQKLVPGDPWVGYLQFCQLFLYPLFLTAYKDLPFHPWLRGAIDGISPEACNQVMSLRDRLRPGVFPDVYLQARLKSMTASSPKSLRSDLSSAGFDRELILRNVRRLTRIVGGLQWKRSRSTWSEYEKEHNYSDADHEAKRSFVESAVGQRPWKLAWDLGCNTGSFSRLAARGAEYVVAMDADDLAIDRFFQQLRQEGCRNILPLVCNLTDPSPGLGWRGEERKAITGRPLPDLTLCLALIHHVVIGANVPLREFIGWLATFDSHLIIEFVTKRDPMVEKLLLNKKDIYTDYELPHFEHCIGDHFEVIERTLLPSETRYLFFVRPRA